MSDSNKEDDPLMDGEDAQPAQIQAVVSDNVELSDSESEDEVRRDVIVSDPRRSSDIKIEQVGEEKSLDAEFPSILLALNEDDYMTYASATLPSRTRHSTRRKKAQQSQDTVVDGGQPGPTTTGDIELQPVSKKSSTYPSRRSVRNTLRKRSQKSVRRGPQDNLNIAERRTLRREDLQQMEKFEVKSLPFCTRIGYEISLRLSRSWNGFKEGLRNTKVWGKAIREVEGNLGSGVSTYFRVLRWLLMINLLNLLVGVSLVTFPGLYIVHTQLDGNSPEHLYNKDNLTCTNPNFLEPNNSTFNQTANNILQFLTGSGWMEATPLYFGYYPSLNITSDAIEYKDKGCTTNDTYLCFTYNTSTEFSSTLATMYIGDENEEQAYIDVFECSINCNASSGACQSSCLECSRNDCLDEPGSSALVPALSTNLKYTCYGGVSTYGSENCQFEDLRADTNNSAYQDLGLKCTSCKRNHVVYNYSLAYVLVGLSYFVLSLLFVGRNIMKLFKKSAIELVGYTPYSQLVLGGWDYNISNRQSAILKSKSIMKSLKEELTSDSQKEITVTTRKKICLYSLRILTNLFCFGAMGGVIYLFYISYNTDNSCTADSTGISFNTTDITGTVSDFFESYAPSIIVSVGNVVFPVVFEFVGHLERYQFQSTRINVTMARSYFMKLFSVVAFMWILIRTINSSATDDSTVNNFISSDDDSSSDFTYNCWEDYVGMELYRLVIMDFLIFCAVLLGAEYFRRFTVDRVKFIKEKFNYTEFNISKEVLDICYKQMIFWAALFFCPLISVVAFIEILLIFYLKKHSALRNVRPPDKVILNSSNSSIINFVFIVSLLVVFFCVGYIMFSFVPSDQCGPFQNHRSFIDPFNVVIDQSGAFKTHILDNLKTTSIIVVITVVIVIIIYYFYSLAAARNLTIHLLREQIKVENADKKFLIEQLKSGNRTENSNSGNDQPPSANNSVNDDIANVKKSKKKAIGTYANPNIIRR